MRVVVILLVSFALTMSMSVVGSKAFAQKRTRAQRIEQAKKAFIAGTKAYEGGAFPKALYHFEKAYDLTKSPDLLYNIATVSDRMRNDKKALGAYEGYIKARPRSQDRQHVMGRIRVLRKAIKAETQSEIRASEDAARRAQRAAQQATAKIKEERPLTKKVPPGAGPWATIGMSGAVMVTGAVFFALGRKDIKKIEGVSQISLWEDFSDIKNRGEKRTKVGVILLGVGAAGVLGGALWQATGWKEEKISEIGVWPGGLYMKGQF